MKSGEEHKTFLKKMLQVGSLLLQFFPLTIFVRAAFWSGTPQTDDWLRGFVWGGVAAILQLVLSLLLLRRHPLNRIILSVNLYLMLGGAAVLSKQMVLLEGFNQLRESSIFICMLIVGICTTTASKAGFVGVTATCLQPDVRRYSLYLLGLTCVALAVSFWFKGQILLSAAIPLIIISIVARVFKRRLSRDRGHKPRATYPA